MAGWSSWGAGMSSGAGNCYSVGAVAVKGGSRRLAAELGIGHHLQAWEDTDLQYPSCEYRQSLQVTH